MRQFRVLNGIVNRETERVKCEKTGDYIGRAAKKSWCSQGQVCV